jgi:hypothetical protein
MPHQCTDCGRAFDDGSKEMLSGCPDCGGTTFQFRPEGVEADPDPETAEEPPEPPGAEGSVARTVGSAATAVRDMVSPSPPGPDTAADGPEAEAPDAGSTDRQRAPAESATEPGGAAEDTAQASARSEIVTEDELPSGAASGAADGPGHPDHHGAPARARDERPDLADLREELNDQFESIRVLEPGQYELNLMELYDREEYIIALQEDGKYTIQVPDRWKDG